MEGNTDIQSFIIYVVHNILPRYYEGTQFKPWLGNNYHNSIFIVFLSFHIQIQNCILCPKLFPTRFKDSSLWIISHHPKTLKWMQYKQFSQLRTITTISFNSHHKHSNTFPNKHKNLWCHKCSEGRACLYQYTLTQCGQWFAASSAVFSGCLEGNHPYRHTADRRPPTIYTTTTYHNQHHTCNFYCNWHLKPPMPLTDTMNTKCLQHVSLKDSVLLKCEL